MDFNRLMSAVNIDRQIFVPAAITVLALVVPISLFPESAEKLANNLIGQITHGLGFLYLLGALALLTFLAWLAFGRYGDVRLGRESDAPEYSKFSWIAMMFCTGMGSSIMNYAFVEPLYFMQGPALGIAAGSTQAAEHALAYSFFHWGFSAYAIYMLPAVPIAYMLYVRRVNLFRMSEAFAGVLGDRVHGPIGKLIDILVILGIIGGTATTLGLSGPVLAALFSQTFGIPNTFGLQVFVLILWTAIFSWSVWRGLSNGIQILSRINALLAAGLLAFVFLTGPTLFILNLTTDSIGILATDFFRMSLWTDPIAEGGYPQAWTIFYWAWWLAYAPMVGLFTARISKGRTLRELILNGVCFGTLGSWVFFAVWGGYSVFAQTTGVIDLSAILSEQGMPAAILAAVSGQAMPAVFMFVFLVLFMVFTATTMDSAAYVLASMSSADLAGEQEPTRFNRVFWAFILGLTATAMLLMGGLKAVQASSVVLGTPMLFLSILLAVSFLRMLRKDCGSALAARHVVIQPAGETEARAASSPHVTQSLGAAALPDAS